VVTGGSRGIGAASARLLAGRGHPVVVGWRSDEAAAAAVVAAIAAAGGEACAVRADVAVESDVVALFEAVDRRYGRLAGLVNSAGVLAAAMPVERIDAERLQRIFAINVIGSFLCAREAVRRMSTRHGGQGGAIVNLSSAAARLGSPNEFVDYAASKGAINTFTIGLSKEVAAQGIRVNAVRPGLIVTDIHRDTGIDDRVGRLAPTVPMQRAGSAEEVAAAVGWLLSDEASYVTGSIVDVAGGR
jgi:NAD(P)-dependent dehydrogenase (short-subunit alcohol dehydrogenase family)